MGMATQLRIYEMENRIGVPKRQQFPYFEKMHWCVVRYQYSWSVVL